MGQALSDALGDSAAPQNTLDPGPLSDAELAEALKRFAEHATDGDSRGLKGLLRGHNGCPSREDVINQPDLLLQLIPFSMRHQLLSR